MASIWMLCLLHCVAEQATAHWHRLPSGKLYHHHHHSTHDHSTHDHSTHDHSTQGSNRENSDPHANSHTHEQTDNGAAHSGDSTMSDCCGLKARISAASFTDRSLGDELPTLNALWEQASLWTPVKDEDPGPCIAANSGGGGLTQVATRIRTLLAPNAPPSTYVC